MNNEAEARVAFFNALATFAAFALLVLLVGGPLALALGVDLSPNQRWALVRWEVRLGLGVVAIVAIAYFCISCRRPRFPSQEDRPQVTAQPSKDEGAATIPPPSPHRGETMGDVALYHEAGNNYRTWHTVMAAVAATFFAAIALFVDYASREALGPVAGGLLIVAAIVYLFVTRRMERRAEQSLKTATGFEEELVGRGAVARDKCPFVQERALSRRWFYRHGLIHWIIFVLALVLGTVVAWRPDLLTKS